MTIAAAAQPSAAQSTVAPATAVQVPSAADHERAMSEYGRRAEARAYALGNRGPIRLGADGKLLPDILESYWTQGFYVFQGVVGPEELQELRADIDAVLSRAPVVPDATVDRHGRPASTEGFLKPPYRWARPLSDPVGGTDKNNGRHPAAMLQPRQARMRRPGRRAARRQPSPQRRLPAPLRPSRAAGRGSVDPRRRFRALQRSDLREGAGPGPVGRLAPGRHDALGRARLGRRARTASTS